MGRLEKQIIIGALALVGVLLSVVVFKGLKPRPEVDVRQPLFISLDGEGVEEEAEKDKAEPRGQDLFPDFGKEQESSKEKVVQQPVRPQLKDQGVPAPKIDDKPWIYEIQPNDTLSEIAQKQLGSQRRMEEILDLNPGLDKNRLVPGETLVLPSKQAREREANGGGSESRVAEAGAKGRTHTVAPGDSLWNLAKKYYGEGHLTDRIVAANPSKLPDEHAVLTVGWVLVIPE